MITNKKFIVSVTAFFSLFLFFVSFDFCFAIIDAKQLAFSEQRKFIGQEFDADTELNYLNARYYDAKRGQFISQDPLVRNNPEKFLTDPQQLNYYSYARNNPLIYSDPEGKKAELVVRNITFPRYNPILGTVNIPTFGAHGFILITAESGENLIQYGDGPRYSIGGYPSNGIGGKLQAQINNPGDLNLPESKYLTSIPLSPPEGMNVAQYDQKLLESGYNLAKSDLGNYFPTGQPISSNPNSGNTATQVVINAGGTFPHIKNTYSGIHLPLGLGTPLGTPSYGQRVATAVNNAVTSVKSAVTSSISLTLNTIKSKLHK